MRQTVSHLWPVRYKPLPDELLSSWLVRIANGNGLKVQTFCNLIFGNGRQVWNRDIDRLAPQWLVAELSARTGTTLAAVQETALGVYEGVLYTRLKASGTLPWIQTMQVYHRKRDGFGMQFCGRCLSNDVQPYFRKTWRVSCNTVCLFHDCMLHDRCPQCKSGVAFHRMDVGHDFIPESDALASCCACKYDLRGAPTMPISSYEVESAESHKLLCQRLCINSDDIRSAAALLEQMRLTHHLCGLLASRYETVTLRQHTCEQLGVEDITLTAGKVAFESRPLAERHHLMQLVAWLEVDLGMRLRRAWRDKAVRYSDLLKGFDNPTFEYREIVEGLSNWRRG